MRPFAPLRNLCDSRVLEILMEPVRVAGKDRAGLLRVIADRQHVVELLSRKLIDRLGPVHGNIDAQFLHDGDRFRSHLAWLRSGAFDLEVLPFVMAQQAFSDLRPCRISCTHDEHPSLICHAKVPSLRGALQRPVPVWATTARAIGKGMWQQRASKLGNHKTWSIGGPDAGKRIRERPRQRNGGIRE